MAKKLKKRRSTLADGFSDRLEPLTPLDIARCKSFSDLTEGMKNTAFGGRCLGEAVDVFCAMVRDKDCLKIGTFSGAMTVAKQGLLLCEMLDRGWLDIVISTGALMAHGFIEASGRLHFKYRPGMNDEELYEKGYDRVYDTLELEKNLDDAEVIVRGILEQLPPGTVLNSHLLNRLLGEYLDRHNLGRGILRSAYLKKVPVYVPAFSDSELGLDLACFNRRRQLEKRPRLPFDPFLDLEDYAQRVFKAKRMGIFTIGGGVPRNWAQQVCPFLDIVQARVGQGGALKKFHYGVRICPEPVHWGGLSGCTYSEGVSWGKFASAEEGGKWAEVLCDATIAWPLLIGAALEKLARR